MKLLKMTHQLIAIADDLRYRFKTLNFDEGELYDFDQTWASTALGFGGVGGSALTTERTYVFIPQIPQYNDKAIIYFGGRFAYVADMCERLREDIIKHDIASVNEKGRYIN